MDAWMDEIDECMDGRVGAWMGVRMCQSGCEFEWFACMARVA